MTSRLVWLAALLATAGIAGADVIVVDPSGQGDFTQINQAVSAAVDGDLVLVKSGTYASFLIPDRSVSVVADAGATVNVNGYVAVLDSQRGDTILISGITAVAQNAGEFGLYLSNNDGSIRIQDSDFTGYTPPPSSDYDHIPPGGLGVFVFACDDVAFTGTTIRGGTGADSTNTAFCLCYSGKGGNGLSAMTSRLAFFDSSVSGGSGGYSSYAGGGGNGMRLNDGTRVLLSNTQVSGGWIGGIDDIIPLCEDGGDGIQFDSSSRVKLIDSTVEGGLAWSHVFGTNVSCSDGDAFSGGGTVVQLPGSARTLHVDAVVREGNGATVTIGGDAGDDAWLAFASAPGHSSSPGYTGKWMVRFPPMMTFAPVGTLGGGLLQTTHHVGQLGAAEHRLIHLQTVVRDVSGAWRLGSTRTLVTLDSAF